MRRRRFWQLPAFSNLLPFSLAFIFFLVTYMWSFKLFLVPFCSLLTVHYFFFFFLLFWNFFYFFICFSVFLNFFLSIFSFKLFFYVFLDFNFFWEIFFFRSFFVVLNVSYSYTTQQTPLSII